MRDIILTLIVFSALPFVPKRPYVGVMLWVWLSVMNPHRLTYGFAYSFPFAQLVAVVTFYALLVAKGPKGLPMTGPVKVLIMFGLWMALSTATAIYPDQSMDMLVKVAKILLMTLVTMMLVRTKHELHVLLFTLAGSLGFFGIKGGLFTIRSGGSDRVWGPPGSFIEGNNEVALAFIVIIPLMYYLMTTLENKWLKRAMLASMLLCALASLGSYSRGALLGLAAMGMVLWWRSPKKLVAAGALVVLIPAAMAFMPEKWFARMDTIQTYQEDNSAMGRINAWILCYNVAKDDPLTGGGFIIYDAATFAKYAPNPLDIHVAHSIYFQVLGEHGWVGLFLYLLLAWLVWRRATWIVKTCEARDDLKWAANLASMMQVSLVGFAVGGAFLSLAYFDVPYYLMAVIVITGRLVEQALAAPVPGTPDKTVALDKPRAPAAGPLRPAPRSTY